MKIIETGIDGLLILEPKVFKDDRGYFFESYNHLRMADLGITNNFVQDNESFSGYGTLRGLHLQKGDAGQAKLVRVVKGKVLDVAVDLRPESKTFKQHFTIELSEENKLQFLVPRGFAHGFVVLSEEAIFQYKCDNYYNKEAEVGIMFNDSELNIDWKLDHSKALLSSKDRENLTLLEAIKVL